MRLAVDNLSINALKKGLQKKEFKTVFNNLGSYLTTDYEIFIKKNPFERYKPISENLAELEKLPNVIKGKQRYVEDKFGKKLEDIKPEELVSIKGLQSKYNQTIFEIGAAEAQRLVFEEQSTKLAEAKRGLLSDLKTIEQKETELIKSLQEKYGEGNINPETGEITPVQQ